VRGKCGARALPEWRANYAALPRSGGRRYRRLEGEVVMGERTEAQVNDAREVGLAILRRIHATEQAPVKVAAKAPTAVESGRGREASRREQ